jgi:hypothetical protein
MYWVKETEQNGSSTQQTRPGVRELQPSDARTAVPVARHLVLENEKTVPC